MLYIPCLKVRVEVDGIAKEVRVLVIGFKAGPVWHVEGRPDRESKVSVRRN